MHYMTVLQRIRNAFLNPAWICFTWLGITVGISLIATTARFSSDAISREVALDVSRVVFAALNQSELLALVLLLIVVRVSGRSAQLWAWCALLILIVLAQGVWLIPELSARTDIILAGGDPPHSYVHGIYASLELAKIGILAGLGIHSLARPD